MHKDASNFAMKFASLKESAQLSSYIKEIKNLNPATRSYFLSQIIYQRVQPLLADQSELECVVEMLSDPNALDFFEIEEMIQNENVLRKRVIEALEVIHHFE